MKRLMVWEPALAANDKHTLISSVAESLAQQGVVSFGEQDALVEALVARHFSIGVKARQWIGSCSLWCPNSRARTMGKP